MTALHSPAYYTSYKALPRASRVLLCHYIGVFFLPCTKSRLEKAEGLAYNIGAMLRLFLSSLLLALLLLPVQPAACQEPGASEPERLGAQLFRVTNEMWLLLSGVVDRTSADAAADRFRALAEQSANMSNMLFDEEAKALDLETLDQNTYRIAEAYEDLSYEFESLCRIHCYGSPTLISAFLTAMRLGIFSDDSAEYLQMSSFILSEAEAEAELARLRTLVEPDSELLRILSHVLDEKQATAAVPELREISDRLRRTLPAMRLGARNFTDKHRPTLQEVCKTLEPLLWKIRTEIVRIVSLPGYDNEPFDDFSDALDSVFESLGDTHTECFDSVFDASFRSDLDDALHGDSMNS